MRIHLLLLSVSAILFACAKFVPYATDYDTYELKIAANNSQVVERQHDYTQFCI